jgi:predicted GIY-YIG superfamily endonuclease
MNIKGITKAIRAVKSTALYSLIDISPFYQPVVYLLCADDQILYVGLSKNVIARIGSHTADGKSFTRIPVFVFETMLAARRAEAKLIRLLNPPLNTKGISQAEKLRRIAKQNVRQKAVAA